MKLSTTPSREDVKAASVQLQLVGIEINKTWHPVSLCDLRARTARFYGPIRG